MTEMPILLKRSTMSSSASKSADRHSIQRLASNALQTKSVTVERFGGVVFRTFRLRTSSEFFYVLRCRPSCHVRLLRHEEDRLKTEATVLQVLRGMQAQEWKMWKMLENLPPASWSPRYLLTFMFHFSGRSDLLVPRLIEYHTTTIALGSFYLISGPFKGSILADVEPSLSSQALASIDRSLGKHVRHIARVTSSSFGVVREAALPGYSSWYARPSPHRDYRRHS